MTPLKRGVKHDTLIQSQKEALFGLCQSKNLGSCRVNMTTSYSFKNVTLGIIGNAIPLEFIVKMVAFTLINSILLPTLYLQFSSNVTVDVHVGFKYFTYMMVFTMGTCYLEMIVNYHKESIMIDYIEAFHKLTHERIFGTFWDRIREQSQEKLRNKIDRGMMSAQNLIRSGINNALNIPTLAGSFWIIANISPYSFFCALFFNTMFYYLYYKKQNTKLIETRKGLHKQTDEFYSRYWKISNNTLDHVIHGENDYMIRVMRDNKVGVEKLWLSLDYDNSKISFGQSIAENICIWLSILVFIHNYVIGVSDLYYGNLINGNVDMLVMILPLYTSLKGVLSQMNSLIQFQANITRWLNDYEELEKIMIDAEPKAKVDQMRMTQSLKFANVQFTNSMKEDGQDSQRKDFVFCTDRSSQFEFDFGHSVLVDGGSGAGKSTFFDILTGITPTHKLKSFCNVYVDGRPARGKFESIEDCRTMVLQDSSVDMTSSCYDIIVGGNIDHVVDDSVIWFFLRMVKIDDVFMDQFGNDLHLEVKDKLSGGQKTRLLLARALFRASEHSRNSSILILDEPDKGLPSDMTIDIIRSVIDWWKDRGILFITLHTKEKYKLPFTQTLTVVDGLMTVKVGANTDCN